jgi:hypothetical protein
MHRCIERHFRHVFIYCWKNPVLHQRILENQLQKARSDRNPQMLHIHLYNFLTRNFIIHDDIAATSFIRFSKLDQLIFHFLKGGFVIFETRDLSLPHIDFKRTIQIFSPEINHRKLVDFSSEQLPNIMIILIGIIISSDSNLGYLNFVKNGLGRQQLGNFKIMNEQLIIFIIEGKIEISQFVQVKILQSRTMFDYDLRYLVYCLE